MTFPEFLESRVGTTLGYTVIGAVVGAVGWPFLLLWAFPRASGRALARSLAEGGMTPELFLHTEVVAILLGAGIGLIRGAGLGPLPSSLLGFVLGVVLSVLASPLGLYAFYFPDGVPAWFPALCIFLATLLGLVLGVYRARENRSKNEQSLTRIRQKSRSR